MRTFIVETKQRVYRIGVPDECVIAIGVAQSGNTVENVWQVTKRLTDKNPEDGHVPVEPCVSIPQVIAFREVGLCDIAVMTVSSAGAEHWLDDPDGALVRGWNRATEVASAMTGKRNKLGQFA